MNRLALLLLFSMLSGSAWANEGIQWQPWSPQVFQQATKSHKLVFLYLEATWCHWCHVMQDTTLKDSGVQSALAHDYLAIRVDHDANPFLANRYRDYGWPALIFFSPDGKEIVKRAGYIEPEAFTRLLSAIVKDPSPEIADQPSDLASSRNLSSSHREDLLRRHRESYDRALGGLKTSHKYVERDSVEYDLTHADDPEAAQRARQTLTAANALIDPVWGGMYQYSTNGDWAHPHFEKIMRTQAGALRIYALAYGRLHSAEDLRAADRIRDYLVNKLRDDRGAFYVSQDADVAPGQKSDGYYALDDAHRRRIGLPRIDRSIYGDANGMAVEALAMHALYANRPESLAAAQQAMEWIIAHRKGSLGGIRHGALQEPVEYLSDNLAVARAALMLYRVTAQRRWLDLASKLGEHIAASFTLASGGLAGVTLNVKPLLPAPVLDENISAARFFNLLAAYSGNERHREAAKTALRWAIGKDSAEPSVEEAGLLLADEEISRAPLHLTVVGSKKDVIARTLFGQANHVPTFYLRVEWIDRSEAALPNQDVVYPTFTKAAGFSCEAQRCSAPCFTASDYASAIAGLTASKK